MSGGAHFGVLRGRLRSSWLQSKCSHSPSHLSSSLCIILLKHCLIQLLFCSRVFASVFISNAGLQNSSLFVLTVWFWYYGNGGLSECIGKYFQFYYPLKGNWHNFFFKNSLVNPSDSPTLKEKCIMVTVALIQVQVETEATLAIIDLVSPVLTSCGCIVLYHDQGLHMWSRLTSDSLCNLS